MQKCNLQSTVPLYISLKVTRVRTVSAASGREKEHWSLLSYISVSRILTD